jgi:hypothetical protein
MLIPFILPHMFHRCMYTCMSVYQMSPGCVHIQINVPRMCTYLIKHRMLQTYKCTTCEKIRMHPPDVHMHIKCSLFVYSCECPQNETPGFKVDKHIPKYPLQMHYSKCTKYICDYQNVQFKYAYIVIPWMCTIENVHYMFLSCPKCNHHKII